MVLTPRRWRQVGGMRFRERWWQTSPVTRESAEEPVKTIARGMPGDSGVTVVTNSRVFFTTRGCGRIGRPAFPAPLLGSAAPSICGGHDVRAKLARNARRDREAALVPTSSSSAKADDPVFQRASDGIEKPRRTGYPACAGYDGLLWSSAVHRSCYRSRRPTRSPIRATPPPSP